MKTIHFCSLNLTFLHNNPSAGVINPQPITAAEPLSRLHTAADSTLLLSIYIFIYPYLKPWETAPYLYLSRCYNRAHISPHHIPAPAVNPRRLRCNYHTAVHTTPVKSFSEAASEGVIEFFSFKKQRCNPLLITPPYDE